MSDPGSGRTTRQLAALPDGALFIVAHRARADYCRGLLISAGRGPEAIRFCTLGNLGDADRLRGTPRGTPCDVDHDFKRCASRRAVEDLAVARRILDR